MLDTAARIDGTGSGSVGELNWRACPTCGVAPADGKRRCHVCGSQTCELWDKDQCAEHCEITVGAWQSYTRLTNNPLSVKRRPPAVLGYHPMRGVGVWDELPVREWKKQRPG
ncbi:MAG: hypothetical protein ACRDQX_00915, partial [Pseudonocardiaceae bacterium]